MLGLWSQTCEISAKEQSLSPQCFTPNGWSALGLEEFGCQQDDYKLNYKLFISGHMHIQRRKVGCIYDRSISFSSWPWLCISCQTMIWCFRVERPDTKMISSVLIFKWIEIENLMIYSKLRVCCCCGGSKSGLGLAQRPGRKWTEKSGRRRKPQNRWLSEKRW
jgi:hypothetical protein